LWEHFNANEVSFWHIRYQKLKNELKNEMYTYNKAQGFLDRTDAKASRGGFGVYSTWWSETDKEYDINGVFLFKGTEVPYLFNCNQLVE